VIKLRAAQRYGVIVWQNRSVAQARGQYGWQADRNNREWHKEQA
jgi:hypothetical protein